MARITVFKEADFKGESKDITRPLPFIGNTFNDKVTSFIVREGKWQLYKDANFENPIGRVFRAGEKVSWVEAVGIPNDSISSLQPV